MLSIRRTRDRANPNSLANRAAKLFGPIVTGAPGDGDTALTRMIRADLADFGPLVQLTPEGADFIVTGKVTVSPLPKDQQQVEIAWTVTWPSGKVVGKVSQLNSVPAGSLDQYWGDVAGAVAQEASGGINAVVERFIDSNKTAPGDATVPQQAGAPGQPPRATNPGTPGSAPTGATAAAGSVPPKAPASLDGTTDGKGPTAHAAGATGAPKESTVPMDSTQSGAPAKSGSNQ
jgi:hypothetical protein